MSAGSVIPRRPRPEQLPLRFGALSPLKSIEPLLQYLQTTAQQTLEIQDQLLEEFRGLRAAIERAMWIADHPNEPPEKIP
jgi:hypothetical protein